MSRCAIFLDRFYVTVTRLHTGSICTTPHLIAILGSMQDVLNLSDFLTSFTDENQNLDNDKLHATCENLHEESTCQSRSTELLFVRETVHFLLTYLTYALVS